MTQDIYEAALYGAYPLDCLTADSLRPSLVIFADSGLGEYPYFCSLHPTSPDELPHNSGHQSARPYDS